MHEENQPSLTVIANLVVVFFTTPLGLLSTSMKQLPGRTVAAQTRLAELVYKPLQRSILFFVVFENSTDYSTAH